MPYSTALLIKEHSLDCQLVDLLMLHTVIFKYTVIAIGTATTMTGPDVLVLPLYRMAQKFKFASKSFR